MTPLQRLAEIEKREKEATAGPWFWRGGKKSSGLKLIGARSWIVMDFVRQGMSGAQPRFLVGAMLEKAIDLLVSRQGQEHNAKWNSDIGHPDAQFIAHSRADIPWLCAEVRRLRELVEFIEKRRLTGVGWKEDKLEYAWNNSDAKRERDGEV